MIQDNTDSSNNIEDDECNLINHNDFEERKFID